MCKASERKENPRISHFHFFCVPRTNPPPNPTYNHKQAHTHTHARAAGRLVRSRALLPCVALSFLSTLFYPFPPSLACSVCLSCLLACFFFFIIFLTFYTPFVKTPNHTTTLMTTHVVVVVIGSVLGNVFPRACSYFFLLYRRFSIPPIISFRSIRLDCRPPFCSLLRSLYVFCVFVVLAVLYPPFLNPALPP